MIYGRVIEIYVIKMNTTGLVVQTAPLKFTTER